MTTLEKFERWGERAASSVSFVVALFAMFHGDWPKASAFLLGAIYFEAYAIRRAVTVTTEPR